MNYLKKDNFSVEIFCKKSNYSIAASCHSKINNWGVIGLTRLFMEVKKKKPKWVLFQYVPYAYSKIGIPILIPFFLLIIRLSGTKVHANFHEISVRLWNGKIIGTLRAICQRFIAYLIILFANSAQTSNANYASLLFPFRIRILPIPSNFEILYDAARINNLFYAKKSELIIISNANRCNTYFFEIIYRLFSLNPIYKLIIIGRATPREILFIESQLAQLKLADRTEMHVNISSDNYLKVFTQADIHFQLEVVKNGKGGVSSKSGAIATALMIGIPTITIKGDLTDADLFVDRKTVLFIPVSNVQLGLDIINQLINDEKLKNDVIQNGKELYLFKLSWHYTCAYIKSLIAA